MGEIIRYQVYSIFINIHFEEDEAAIMGPHKNNLEIILLSNLMFSPHLISIKIF